MYQKVRKATKKDFYFLLFLKLLGALILFGIPALIYKYNNTSITILLIGILLSLVPLFFVINDIIKYVIKKEDYDFYIIKDGNTTTFCRGRDLKVSNNNILEDAPDVIDPSLRYTTQANKRIEKFEVKVENVLEKSHKKILIIVGVVVFLIPAIFSLISLVVSSIDLPDDLNPTFVIAAILFNGGFAILALLFAIYFIKSVKKRNDITTTEHIDENEVDDDPFAKYYEKRENNDKDK